MSDDPFATGAGFGYDEDFEIVVDVRRPPEGIAIVQLMNVENKVSKSGNKMWVWDFIIRSYLEPDDVGNEFEGESITVFTALSKNAMWKLEETLTALGVKIGEGGAVKFKKEQLLGVCAKAVIKQGEYNNRPQTNIEALAPHPKGPGHKMDLPTMNHPGADGDIPF